MGEMRIRALSTPGEYEQVVHIQKAVWGFSDIDLTPAHHFDISVKTGAIMIGAFMGEDLAGYVYSFPARYKNHWIQHSRQLGVLPRFRGRDIGKKLKWAQRRDALAKGYKMITWTVEPLLSLNAHLNFHTLGVVTRTYLADYYKAAPALSMAAGVPVDRLYLEWHLHSSRVVQREKGLFSTEGMEAAAALEGSCIANPGFPGAPDFSLTEEKILIEIPKGIKRNSRQPSFVLAWQGAVRRTMEKYFAGGYWIVDFFLREDRCFFVLRRPQKGEWDGI
jgi:predicted GNAT superfamily acetyltransferase